MENKFTTLEEYIEENTIYLTKMEAIFDKKYYKKYDKFKFGNLYYICISNPRKTKKGYIYEVFPCSSGIEYNKNNKYPTYYVPIFLSEDIEENYRIAKKFFNFINNGRE